MPTRYNSTYLPPMSGDHDTPYINTTLYTMAPPWPYVPLPPETDDWQPFPNHSPSTLLDGVMTPPPSPSHVHSVLTAEPTVVLYDFKNNPENISMTSSSQYLFFPKHGLALSPPVFELDVRCDAMGRTIKVQTPYGAVTCFDLMAQLHHYFAEDIPREEWQDVQGKQRKAMKKAYQQRTRLAYLTSARMKRIDYLLGQTKFKRIIRHSENVMLLQTY